MPIATIKTNKIEKMEIPNYLYSLLEQKGRFLIWKKVKGMWKNRKPEPIKELKKMRQEWKIFSSV
ncbi:hypothetical protein KKA09_00655 [Patescibacteria group bacterium]|nr:hypothetical protein [Patescibacteria group bacterium]